jgi:AraC-like DNA-binding protein
VLYWSYTPRAPLSQYVPRLWLVEGGQSSRQERILPSGTAELVVNLRHDRITIDRTLRSARARSFSGAALSGTYSGAFVINAMHHELMIGAHFSPGGACAVFGTPGVELADEHVDLGAVVGDASASGLRERLCEAATHEARFRCLEQVLTNQLRSKPPLHAAVRLALERFSATGSGASVAEVVQEAGLSHRRFLTLFTAQVGLPPKLFCRVLRFRHLHGLAQRTGRIDWAQLAQECGFFDQAHLACEFRKLAGITPSDYRRDLGQGCEVLDGHVVIS